MRLAALHLLFCLLALRSYGAVGDVVQVYIRPDGWSADVVVEGIGTNNNSFNFYLTSVTNIMRVNGVNYTNWYNKPSANTPRFTVSVPGFDTTGTSNWTSRTIFGVDIVRSNVPNQTYEDQIMSLPLTPLIGHCTNRIALSDFICAADSVTAFNIAANTISNNAANSGLSVANNSTVGYMKPSARFSMPGWNLLQGATHRLHAVGFSHWPTNFQPLACMKFIVRGEDGVGYTNIQTEMQADWSITNDAVRSAEYFTDIPLIGFANSNQLRCDFIAYPWRGNQVFSTLDNEWSMPTPFPAAITNFYHTNTYSANAVVSLSAVGPGVATNQSNPALIDPAHYFTNGNFALNAIRSTNNTLFGHQDVGGAFVWYRTGVSNWSDGTRTTATTPKCWVTLKEYPGDTVVWTNVGGNQDISDLIKIEDVEFGWTGTQVPFINCSTVWIRNCRLNGTGTAPFSVGIPYLAITGGTSPVWTQGFRRQSSTGPSWALVRGVDMTGMNSLSTPWHWQGNLAVSVGTTFGIELSATSWESQPARYQIVYNNVFKSLDELNIFTTGGHWTMTNGLAIVQNLIESKLATTAMNFFSANLVASNVLCLGNTIEGTRVQYFYNSSVGTGTPFYLCHGYNNIWPGLGEATDTDTAAPGADGDRVLDWSVRHRVGTRGDVIQMVENQNSHGVIEFKGLHNYNPVASGIGAGGTERSSTNWMQYMNRAGGGVSSSGAGGGNYKLRNRSPALYIPAEQALPRDIEGRPRGRGHGFDNSGAYNTPYLAGHMIGL